MHWWGENAYMFKIIKHFTIRQRQTEQIKKQFSIKNCIYFWGGNAYETVLPMFEKVITFLAKS